MCQVLKPGLPCYSFTLLREKWHGGGESAAASGDIYSLKSWAIADLKEDLVAAGAPAAATIYEEGGEADEADEADEAEAVRVVPLTKARLKEHDAAGAHGGGVRASRATPAAAEGAAADGEAHESAVARGTVPAWVFNQYSELASRAAPGGLAPSAQLEYAQLDRPKPGKSARPKSGARGARPPGASAAGGACGAAGALGAEAEAGAPARGSAQQPTSPPRLGSRAAPLSHREAPQPPGSLVEVPRAQQPTPPPTAPEARPPEARPLAQVCPPWAREEGPCPLDAEERPCCGLRSGARLTSPTRVAVEPAGRAT